MLSCCSGTRAACIIRSQRQFAAGHNALFIIPGQGADAGHRLARRCQRRSDGIRLVRTDDNDHADAAVERAQHLVLDHAAGARQPAEHFRRRDCIKIQLDAEAIRISGDFNVAQARISIEQPAAAQIPTLSGIRRVNFPDRDEDVLPVAASPFQRPMQLNLKITAPRRIVVFGRGLDTEWAADFRVTGQVSDPSIDGTATLVRGDLDLAGKRFTFDTGTIELNGPIRTARINIAAERAASDVTASVVVSGTPVDPKFTLESTPSLPQDEILARVLFGRSAAELSGFEAAQLAAGLAQLAGGNAGFDPVGLVRQATGLDRVSFGAQDGVATVSAGKYIAEDVYLQVGAGGTGGVGAEVEWEPRKEISIISSAQGNGDTKIAVRWKRDY